MGLILDTSALIEVERGRVSLEAIGSLTEEVAVSAITVAELLHGAHRADTEPRRLRRTAFVETLTAAFTVYPFDMGTARIYAQIWAEMARVGVVIGAHDLMIGATALAIGYQVCTINVRDFSRIPNLELRRVTPG